MGLYLGNSEKLKMSMANTIYNLILPAIAPSFNGVVLLSSDNFTLLDANGLYLTAKEGE